MQSNCIKNLLNLEDVLVKKVKNLEHCVEVSVEIPLIKQVCPCCHSETIHVHDYYTQNIKDLPIHFKPTILKYKKRRYICKNCGKRFYEQNSIISKYSRKTTRLVELVVEELRKLTSQKDVAKRTNISPSIISKMLPYLAVTNTTLPRVLCIDEFKGNTGNYKYQVALINGETQEVVDILECRHKHALCEYFKKFPQEQLDNVKYLVSDLWEPYKDISMTYLRKAKIVADHFHFVRIVCKVVNDLRISVQKKLPQKERKYFKHSRKLLLARRTKIKAKEKLEELNYILINYSEDLRIAYREKETLLDIIHSVEACEIKVKQLKEWVEI